MQNIREKIDKHYNLDNNFIDLKLNNDNYNNNINEPKTPISEISTLRFGAEEDFINIIESKVKILEKLSKDKNLNVDNYYQNINKIDDKIFNNCNTIKINNIDKENINLANKLTINHPLDYNTNDTINIKQNNDNTSKNNIFDIK